MFLGIGYLLKVFIHKFNFEVKGGIMSERIRTDGEEILRVKTHFKDIDDLLGGGIPETHTTILAGNFGTMKTSFALLNAYNQVLYEKKNVLFISLDQSFAALQNQLLSLKFNLADISIIRLNKLEDFEKDINKINVYSDVGCLIIADYNCIGGVAKQSLDDNEVDDWINIIKNLIKKIRVEVHLETVILDSVNYLLKLSSFKKAFLQLRELKLLTKRNSINLWFIFESSSLDDFETSEINLLADTNLFIQRKIYERKIIREFIILSSRQTNHDIDKYTLVFKEKEFKVLDGGVHPRI